jgi:hypothetical protein
MSKARFVFLRTMLFFSLLLPLSGCFTTRTLQTPFEAELVKSVDNKTMEQALMTAAAKRGEWVMSKTTNPGEMIGELNSRGHYMKVKFAYKDQKISATYLDSRNLGYDGVHIHKKYHMWLSAFLRTLNKVLEKSTPSSPK